MRTIKKYPNRRLYDTEKSKYIKLDDIKTLVIENIDFKVIEISSECDVTNLVLLQIINDEESDKMPFFTKQVLLNIIKLYGHPMQKVTKDYLDAVFSNLDNKEKIHEDYAKTFSDVTKKNLEIWKDITEQYFDAASNLNPLKNKKNKK